MRTTRHLLEALLLALTAVAAQAGDTTNRYDAAGRLVEVRYANGKVVRYAYDANGNLLRRAVDDAGIQIEAGDTVLGALTPGDVDAVSFHELAGNTVTLALSKLAGGRLRVKDADGAEVDVSMFVKTGATTATVKSLPVTSAMLGGRAAGFLSVEVYGADVAAQGAWRLSTSERTGAANLSLRVTAARPLADAVPMQLGTSISGTVGAKANPATLAGLSVLAPGGGPAGYTGGKAPKEIAAKGTVSFTAVPVAGRGVFRLVTTTATVARLSFVRRYRPRTIQFPAG